MFDPSDFPSKTGGGETGDGPVDRKQLVAYARTLLKTAHDRTSMKFIYELAKASQNQFQSKEETLRKFLQDEKRGLDNSDDLLRIVRIFSTTSIGAALVAPLKSQDLNPDGVFVSSDREIRSRMISEILRPAASAHLELSAQYLVYHSGLFEDEKYSIRFMKLIHNPFTGQITFEDRKTDREPFRVREGHSVSISYGNVRFFMGKPHFVSNDTFSGVGSRLIVIDRWIMDGSSAQTLVGRMSGMTDMGNSYAKDVLLHRWDGSEPSGHRETGNFSSTSLKASHRLRFAELTRMRPSGGLVDEALDALLGREKR